MAIINKQGYVAVKTKTRKTRKGRVTYRTFWIGRQELVFKISLPRRYWGKRIALKVIELNHKKE